MNFTLCVSVESGGFLGKGSTLMSVERRKTASGVRYRFVKMIHGQRIRSPYIYLTKDQAVQAESEYLHQRLMGQTPSAFANISETVLELLTRRIQWLKDHRSEKHAKDNENIFQHVLKFAPEWARRSIQEITPQMAQEMAEKFAADLLGRRKTRLFVNKALVALQSTWNYPWGTRRGRYAQNNPFAITERFPVEKKTKRIPTQRQIQKVMDACNDEQKLFVELMKETGARPGELLRLEWQDVEVDTITLKTRKKKGGDLTPRKIKYILHKPKTKGRIFPHTRWWPVQFFRDACEKAGVPFINPHAIRHFHASKLIAEGWTIPQIQARLGHESPMTTAKYIHELLGV